VLDRRRDCKSDTEDLEVRGGSGNNVSRVRWTEPETDLKYFPTCRRTDVAHQRPVRHCQHQIHASVFESVETGHRVRVSALVERQCGEKTAQN
jgi:hypothetical protein